LIGQKQAIERWQRVLSTVETTITVDRETRQFELSHARPSSIIRPMSSLSVQLLKTADADDGTLLRRSFTAVDELDLLIVTAVPGQLPVIQNLIATLDESKPQELQFQIVRVKNRSPGDLAEDAQARYEAQTADLEAELYGPVKV
jgi:type II secretory pathway component GspD/PulD (secretin)